MTEASLTHIVCRKFMTHKCVSSVIYD